MFPPSQRTLSEVGQQLLIFLRTFGVTSRNSIRFHLFAALSLVAFLPLLFLSIALWSKLRSSAINESQQYMAIVVDEVGKRIGEQMKTIERNLESLQSNPRLVNDTYSKAIRKSEINRLLSIYDDFHDISLYQPNGDIIVSTNEVGPDPAPYREHTTWFHDALKSGKRTVSRPTRRIGLEGLFIVVYLPIKGESGVGDFIIRASLRFDKIQNILKGLDLAKTGEFLLVDELGLILHDKTDKPLPRRLDTELQWPEWVSKPRGDHLVRGVRSIYATRVLPPQETRVGHSWLLIGHQPMDEAFSTVEEALGAVWVFLIISALGVLVAAPYVSHRLVDQLSPLIQAAHHVAEGNWDDIEFPTNGALEIQALSNSFLAMATEIRHHQDELEKKVEDRTKELDQNRRQLADTNAQLEAAFLSTLEGVLVVEKHGHIQTINRRFLEFFELSPEFSNLLTVPDLEERVHEIVEELQGFRGFDHMLELPVNDNKIRQRQEAEWHIQGMQEYFLKVYTVDVRNEAGESLAILWVLRDFTEARTLETNLQQAQKMEAVGRLAGGIAHDFNNLLTGIIGNLALVHFEMDPKSSSIEDLESAQQASQRAAELVKQLLGYTRQSFLNLDFCNPNSLVDEVATFLGRSFDPSIQIITQFDSRIWDVQVDGTQINQVLMNLCVNARDAMEERGKGGQLVLSTKNLTLKTSDARGMNHSSATPGKYVCLSVADDGSGIPAKVMDRIFDPFFTTKGQGKGTGLGLATSLGIVEQHGGWMTCDTKIGEGTVFRVYLPKALCGENHHRIVQTSTVVESVGGHETLLLVDDEAVVRGVSEKFLRRKGYQTLSACDGLVGLEVFDQHQGEIELVMLDLTMPRLSGADTFKELRRRDPNLPIIIYSGYVVDDEQFEAENGSRPNAILCKPFDLNDLATIIREVIDESPIQIAA